MRAKDLLICIREDNYTIDTLEFIKCPKVDDFVEVRAVKRDQDGVWLILKGYDVDMFDANCFRKATLEDTNKLAIKKVEYEYNFRD